MNCEPLPGSLCTSNRAAVGLDDLAGGRQAQAASRRSGREKRVEDAAHEPLRSFPRRCRSRRARPTAPRAGSSGSARRPRASRARRSKPGSRAACLNRSRIEQAKRQVASKLGADHDSLGRRVRLVEVAELVDDRVQIGRLELQVLDAGEPEKVLEDAVQPLDLVLQPLDPLAARGGRAGSRGSESPRAADRDSAKASRADCGSHERGRRRAGKSRRTGPAAAGDFRSCSDAGSLARRGQRDGPTVESALSPLVAAGSPLPSAGAAGSGRVSTGVRDIVLAMDLP